MTKKELLEEKELIKSQIASLQYRLQAIDEAVENVDKDESYSINLDPWKKDILWQVADIFRTSPINVNYPYGYDCNTCSKCGNDCTCDGDGIDCNWAFMHYLEEELEKRY